MGISCSRKEVISMMTKAEFCKSYIYSYERKNYLEKVTHSDVFKDTNVGICMDYLGLTNKTEKEYLSDRGGILYQLVNMEKLKNDEEDFYKFLTIRELIDLLPDKE
jgi:hypothetical protein